MNVGLTLSVVLQLLHPSGLGALRTIRHFELYFLSFSQRFIPFALYRGEVYKNVRATILLDEPITLVVIEPFHETRWHVPPKPTARSKTPQPGCEKLDSLFLW